MRNKYRGEIQVKVRGGKGLFLGLSWLAFALIAAIAAFVVYLIIPRAVELYFALPIILWALAGALLAIIGGGLLLITIAAFAGLDVLYPHGGDPITMRVLFPVVLTLGRILGFDKERLREAFVDTNNALILAQRKRISVDRVLFLLPHCLQNHECPWKITYDMDNCKRCGKCDIAALYELSERYNTDVRVATGGTLALRAVRDFKPTIILAVACGRDLAAGIIDAHPYPVFGIPNERPNGPCFDTKVDVRKVESALKELIGASKTNESQ